jgi:hypothetical protein
MRRNDMAAKKLEPEEAKKLLAIFESIDKTSKTFTATIAKFMTHLSTTYNLDTEEWGERMAGWFIALDEGPRSVRRNIRTFLQTFAHPISEEFYNVEDKK